MKSSFFTRCPRLLTAALTCLLVVMSHAATFTVSNTSDSGAGSLRNAITNALAGCAGPHDIQAGGVIGTISLQTALPTITNSNITIHGPTSGTLTVTRGTGTFRIFTVNNSSGAATGTYTGDGAVGRAVNIGFQPDVVIIHRADTAMRVQIRVTGMAETKDVALTSNGTNLLFTALACALPLSRAEEQPKTIPFEQLSAEAQKQDSGDWIGITPTVRGQSKI
jgi:hypothetical protein